MSFRRFSFDFEFALRNFLIILNFYDVTQHLHFNVLTRNCCNAVCLRIEERHTYTYTYMEYIADCGSTIYSHTHDCWSTHVTRLEVIIHSIFQKYSVTI